MIMIYLLPWKDEGERDRGGSKFLLEALLQPSDASLVFTCLGRRRWVDLEWTSFQCQKHSGSSLNLADFFELLCLVSSASSCLHYAIPCQHKASR